jgi:hypothetical protein
MCLTNAGRTAHAWFDDSRTTYRRPATAIDAVRTGTGICMHNEQGVISPCANQFSVPGPEHISTASRHRLDHNCRASWYVPTPLDVKEPRAAHEQRNRISEALFIRLAVRRPNGTHGSEGNVGRETSSDEPLSELSGIVHAQRHALREF